MNNYTEIRAVNVFVWFCFSIRRDIFVFGTTFAGMAHLHVPICMCKVACADFAHAKNFACAKPYPNIHPNTHTYFRPKILHGQKHTLT